jgi:hypothetical protein
MESLQPFALKKDFFISYNKADRPWAEWIAWQLEEEGYSVILQDWDFRPGSNFVHEMDKASKQAERTILVLSPDYLRSPFTASEWFARFAQDPTGDMRKLLPIRVQECRPDGLLRLIVYIDLVALDASAARNKLLADVRTGRAKPTIPPAFPVTLRHSSQKQPPFPGYLPQTQTTWEGDQNSDFAESYPHLSTGKAFPISWKTAKWIIVPLLVVGFFSWMGYSIITDYNSRLTPLYRLQDFCDSLKHHDYDSAYADFQDSLKSHVSESQFIANVHTVADPRGGIGDCMVSIEKQIGTIAHGKITFTFGDGSTKTERYDLFQNSYSYWSITSWVF